MSGKYANLAVLFPDANVVESSACQCTEPDGLLDENVFFALVETLASRKEQEETSPRPGRVKGRSLVPTRPSLVGLGPLNQCKCPR